MVLFSVMEVQPAELTLSPGLFINMLAGHMGKTMFLFDACVITISLITYLNYKQAMYTLVAVFVGARVIDFMQEGAYSARGAMVISDKYEEIGEKIMAELDRGVTVLKGYGFYTRSDTRSHLLRCC